MNFHGLHSSANTIGTYIHVQKKGVWVVRLTAVFVPNSSTPVWAALFTVRIFPITHETESPRTTQLVAIFLTLYHVTLCAQLSIARAVQPDRPDMHYSMWSSAYPVYPIHRVVHIRSISMARLHSCSMQSTARAMLSCAHNVTWYNVTMLATNVQCWVVRGVHILY